MAGEAKPGIWQCMRVVMHSDLPADPPDVGTVVQEMVAHMLVSQVRLMEARATTCHDYARFLHVAPVLCTSARDEVRNHPAYPALIYYERLRLNLGRIRSSPFFLEGVPRALTLFKSAL